MAEHDVPLVYDASIGVTSNALTTWHGDGDSSTYLTLNTGGSLWSAVASTDLTAVAEDVAGFRLEVDVSAGSSMMLDYTWNVQHPTSTTVAVFDLLLDLPGPGTYTFAGPTPTIIDEPAGFDLWEYVTAAMAMDPSTLAALMLLQPDPAEPSVTLTGFRVIFTVVTARPATRLFPRDDALGLGSAPRLVPPPKAQRVVGGYQ